MTTTSDFQRCTTRFSDQGARIECETRIDVPREFLWELIQDPSRRIEWDARLTDATLTTQRPIGKETRIRTSYAMLGWVEIEYTSWQPPARSAVKTVGMSRGNVIHSFVASWNFIPQPDGSTVWKTQIVIRGVGGGVVSSVVERYLLGPVMAWLTPLSARNLKKLAEQEYAAQRVAQAA
jgi:hypothetical protein